MQVILLERIEKLGQMGDVVTVRPGFARNFLLPQKKALRAFYLRPSHILDALRRLRPGNLMEASKIAIKGFF